MRPTPRARLAAALLPLLLLAGACGSDDDEAADRDPIERDDATTTTQADDEDDGDDGDAEDVLEGLDDIPVEDQDDAIIEATLTEVEAFWEDAFPEVFGGELVTVQGGFVPYGPDRELPECGGPLAYEEIAQNAFYCPNDDVIAWDTDNLTNDLLAEFGPFSLAIVMAHEYGHAVQARVPVIGSTIATEQQADCFAGAFTAFVEGGGSDVLSVSFDDLDAAVAGFLTLRDAPGTPAADPSAHGSAFDRIGAFQDGFQNGAERCAEYEEIYDSGGTTVIDLQFTDPEDFQRGGNAPFDPAEEGDIFELTLGSLETFWLQVLPEVFGVDWDVLVTDDRVVPFSPEEPSSLPECPGTDIDVDDVAGQAFTCVGDPDDPSDDFIAFDVDLVADQYERIGDFAVSGLIAQQYALRAQVLLGNLDSDRLSLLQSDCFSGAWTGVVTVLTLTESGQSFDPSLGLGGGVSISAGDLDEIVQSFLLLGQPEGADEAQGTPFERIAAFRDGFLNGIEECASYLEDGAPDASSAVPDEDG